MMADKEPFAVQAAKASWLAPVIAVALNFFVNIVVSGDGRTDLATKHIIILVSGGLAIAIVLSGLVLGIIALCGIQRHGAKRIVVPALIGIVLCAGYLALLFSAVQVARETAKKAAASQS